MTHEISHSPQDLLEDVFSHTPKSIGIWTEIGVHQPQHSSIVPQTDPHRNLIAPHNYGRFATCPGKNWKCYKIVTKSVTPVRYVKAKKPSMWYGFHIMEVHKPWKPSPKRKVEAVKALYPEEKCNVEIEGSNVTMDILEVLPQSLARTRTSTDRSFATPNFKMIKFILGLLIQKQGYTCIVRWLYSSTVSD